MQKEELTSFNEALNQYFKLKNTFETQINIIKKKIINNPTLSNREKRAEYLKIMPKCINCKRPSRKGTIFSTSYHLGEDDSEYSSYRLIKASCGVLADPCNLDIQIKLDHIESLETTLDELKNEIKDYKNKIINDKNKLLFGIIDTETAIENFEENKSSIEIITTTYEICLDSLNKIIDNPEKKIELDESLVLSYNLINEIKLCIKKMNENNESKYATDAATIYVTTLKPLLDKIRHLKYSENMVFHDDDNNTCRLIQNKHSINDLSTTSSTGNEVLKFDIGYQAKKSKKKPLFIIESDESKPEKEGKELTIKITEPVKPKPSGELPSDEPIIGQGDDGIEWNIEEYKNLWSKLPPKLKDAFKQNIEWMKDFMHNCVNAKQREGIQYNGCRLTTPPNLIIPPKVLPDGKYDFGVPIYNIAFNKQPKTLQETYLTFYKADPKTKQKNYKMLEDAMNSLVEREVDFGRGFF
jgi:hypothetical protein